MSSSDKLLTQAEVDVLLGKIPTATLTEKISSDQLAWRNHPETRRWSRNDYLITHEQHAEWLKEIKTDPSMKVFGVTFGELEFNYATVSLKNISYTDGSAEFSVLVCPNMRRKGYGQAALIELLKYAFKTLRLNCVYGETFDGNPALQMFLKIGMREEGRLRSRYYRTGNYIDSHTVSILHEEAKEQPWWK